MDGVEEPDDFPHQTHYHPAVHLGGRLVGRTKREFIKKLSQQLDGRGRLRDGDGDVSEGRGCQDGDEESGGSDLVVAAEQ